MRAAGTPGSLLLCAALTACSPDGSLPPVTYVLPSPPTETAVIAGVKIAASQANLTAPLEIYPRYDLRDRGPGRYFVCLRGNQSLPMSDSQATDVAVREDRPQRQVTYSVFFNDDVYTGARQSVILEACETQAFTPIDLSPPPPPPMPKSTKKSKR